MDHFVSREREVEVDLESGENTSEEDRTEDLVATDRRSKKVSERVWSGVMSFAKAEKDECNKILLSDSLSFREDVEQNVELCMYKNSDGEESVNYMSILESKHGKDKFKKANFRNPLKPPRPPKGPSLDAADRKLIREIAEIAVRKRARVERMKTLKKMKASKASPSKSSLSGMAVTLIFCLVLLYQGLSSRSSTGISPEPAVAIKEDLISVQFYNNLSTDRSPIPGSRTLNSAEDRVSGSDLERVKWVELQHEMRSH